MSGCVRADMSLRFSETERNHADAVFHDWN